MAVREDAEQRTTLAEKLRLRLDSVPAALVDYKEIVRGTQLSPRSVQSEPC